MASNILIQIDSISKQYRLGEISTGSLGHDLNRWWHRLRGKEDPYLDVTRVNVRDSRGGKTDYVWALRDVSFEVSRGEVLGIVGRNGAGKSTLLKILSRITAPTQGEVRIDGRIASLLEVGTGFHLDLTGRENIYLNGAILGMTRTEIRRKLDEIADFSGCARYLDTPVKRYSSGMVVRLGFAVAAYLEPDILIVDEVLAVGDYSFQTKCIGKMSEAAREGRTILFVSHNLAAVQSLCTAAVLLEDGHVSGSKGTVGSIIAAYETSGRSDAGVNHFRPQDHQLVTSFQVSQIETLGADGRPTPAFKYGEPIRIRLVFHCVESMKGIQTGIAIRAQGLVVATAVSPSEDFEASGSDYTTECVVPGGALRPGAFELDLGCVRTVGHVALDYIRDAIRFTVSDMSVGPEWAVDRHTEGMVNLPFEWSGREECAPCRAPCGERA